jgi:hypothetical protein
MSFVAVKTPHFVHFDADFQVRMRFKVFLVHATYLRFFFLIRRERSRN